VRVRDSSVPELLGSVSPLSHRMISRAGFLNVRRSHCYGSYAINNNLMAKLAEPKERV
jgi:hypothetical protein